MKTLIVILTIIVVNAGVLNFTNPYKMQYDTPYGHRFIAYYKSMDACNADKPTYKKIIKQKQWKNTTLSCVETPYKRLKDAITNTSRSNKGKSMD